MDRRVGTSLATYWRLGLNNLARVGAYRVALRNPLSRLRRMSAAIPAGPFFSRTAAPPVPTIVPVSPLDEYALFGHAKIPLGDPPDWHQNPLTGQRVSSPDRPWWAIPDFDPAVGDIKGVWELSRFDWVPIFALRARNGEGPALQHLNAWLQDWCQHNPPYCGPNWKCGQEASVRVMRLALAQILLGDGLAAEGGLRGLVTAHLSRIGPTTAYAIGQDNNHGTSEAAALFIGGTWLGDRGARWERMGRSLLEDRVRRLIQADGSFSQYSVNYHRLVLDTLALAEIWRRRFGRPRFSSVFYQRAATATEWLRRLVSPQTGDAPNVGANDGAKLIAIGGETYRDHRPTVQLCAALFLGHRAYAPGPWDATAEALSVDVPSTLLPAPVSHAGEDGGFAALRNSNALALLRYPRFRFRPSQSDLQHLDVWLAGENILRDAGTYSYNGEPEWLAYFGGVAAHNTVEFDGRDQMPRLGRFLFGAWPRSRITRPLKQDGERVTMAVAYSDARACHHERRIHLAPHGLTVEDEISGFSSKAVLRWRLAPGTWRQHGATVTRGDVTLGVVAGATIERCELRQGYESRHYLERTELPVLEVEVRRPTTLISHLEWHA